MSILVKNIKIIAILIFMVVLMPDMAKALDKPASWDFGNVILESTSKATVNISSDKEVILTRIILAKGTYFQVITQISGDGLRIEPNQSVGIEIVYTPTIVGPVDDAMYIYTNNPFTGRATVYLSGIGVPNKIAIDDILHFFDSSVSTGSLIGSDGKKSSEYQVSLYQQAAMIEPNGGAKAAKGGKSEDNRLNAFRNKLKSVDNMVDDKNIHGACEQLLEIYQKTDGLNPPQSPPDFIEGQAKAELAAMITAFRLQLQCE